VFLGLQLIAHEALQVLRLKRRCELAVADLFDVPEHVILDRTKGNGAQDIWVH
jgi:hypothetical protein